MITGERIEELIPQRAPIIMIDTLYGATDTEADTGLTIADDNIFCRNGHFEEAGLIEHIAQSASAFAGYKAKMQCKPVPLGLLGDVKKMKINFLPSVGNKLQTHICLISEISGISLFTAETIVDGKIAAQCRIKIFIDPEK